MQIHRQERRLLFSKLPETARPLIFAGDSLTEEGAWSELFGFREPILNRGVSSEKVDDLRERAGEIQGRNPKAIFVMIGINDLQAGRSRDEVVSSYRSLLKQLTSSPETKVIVQSVLPVNRSLNPALTVTPTEIAALNEELSRLASEHGARFVDLSPAFRDALGELRGDLTRDGLHLNTAGYFTWREKIGGLVKEMTVSPSPQP
jgi:lysophospholipase L1-like esterase